MKPSKQKNKIKKYIFKQIAQLPNLFKYVYFCFTLLCTSSSPCRKNQFAVSYFSTSKSLACYAGCRYGLFFFLSLNAENLSLRLYPSLLGCVRRLRKPQCFVQLFIKGGLKRFVTWIYHRPLLFSQLFFGYCSTMRQHPDMLGDTDSNLNSVLFLSWSCWKS